MKKQIITIASIFASILLLGILFITFSPTSAPEASNNDSLVVSVEPITITTFDKSITLSASQVPQFKKILEHADSYAITREMFCDSNTVTTLGKIDRYKFNYHYTIVSTNTKIHGITVLDTIDSTEVYIGRYNKFMDNLTVEKELITK